MPLDALAGSKARVRSDKNLKVRLESKCSFSVAWRNLAGKARPDRSLLVWRRLKFVASFLEPRQSRMIIL